MNTAMWDHPLTGQQLSTVQGFGWIIIDPISKQLACGDVGFGAMEAPSAIADAVGRSAHEYLWRPQPCHQTSQPQVVHLSTSIPACHFLNLNVLSDQAQIRWKA